VLNINEEGSKLITLMGKTQVKIHEKGNGRVFGKASPDELGGRVHLRFSQIVLWELSARETLYHWREDNSVLWEGGD